MVIGPGSVNLSLRRVWARAALASAAWNGAFAAESAGHGRHVRLVAIGADADICAARKVDAVELARKPCTKCRRACSPSLTMSMPASSCSFTASTVASSLPPQARRLRASMRARRSWFREPDRLGEAAGDRGFEHGRPGDRVETREGLASFRGDRHFSVRRPGVADFQRAYFA